MAQFVSETVITQKTTLDVEDIGDGLFVYRVSFSTSYRNTGGSFKPPKPKATAPFEGLTDANGVEKLKAGKMPREMSTDLHVVPDEVYHRIRDVGIGNLEREDWKLVGKNVYTALTRDGLTPDHLKRINISNHRLYDRFGKVLPFAIHFGYIGIGQPHAADYDLRQLARHLLKRKDVTLYSNERHTAVAQSADDAIIPVPYYNIDAHNGGKHLSFVWHPSVEDIRRVVAHEKAQKRKYETTDYLRAAIAELDILGMEKFRKKPLVIY